MRRAFSLVELLTVLGIVGAVLVSGLGVWENARILAQRSQARQELSTLAAQAELIRARQGAYPQNFEAAKIDPWNQPYDYSYLDGAHVTLKSLGPDGVQSSDDIVYAP